MKPTHVPMHIFFSFEWVISAVEPAPDIGGETEVEDNGSQQGESPPEVGRWTFRADSSYLWWPAWMAMLAILRSLTQSQVGRMM